MAGTPRPAETFPETGLSQPAHRASRELRWGWDGASLKSVSGYSVDPIGYSGGINLYEYVGAAPTSMPTHWGRGDMLLEWAPSVAPSDFQRGMYGLAVVGNGNGLRADHGRFRRGKERHVLFAGPVCPDLLRRLHLHVPDLFRVLGNRQWTLDQGTPTSRTASGMTPQWQVRRSMTLPTSGSCFNTPPEGTRNKLQEISIGGVFAK